jgi:NhaA family Na+:H+ antiporter
VAFGIVPIFAFANAGLPIPTGRFGDLLTDPVVLGIGLGLVVGKTVGVFGASWVLVRTGVARMPAGVTHRHIFGAALCAGIGFTVAIFVAGLAFADPAVIETAKLAIILASAVAAVLGYVWLRTTATHDQPRLQPR